MHKPSLLIGILLLSLVARSSSADTPPTRQPLDYRTFVSGPSLWMWDHESLQLYRSDTKALKTISFSDSLDHDPVIDVAENSSVLWVVASSGIYQADMATSTVEHIPGGPKSLVGARVAADVDFAWVAQHDTLWKFDKLSREWFAYAFGKAGHTGEALVGAFSDGTKVYIMSSSSIFHFSISDEKWNVYPYNGFSFSPRARYFPSDQALTVIEGNQIFRYLPSKLSWDKVAAPSEITDVQISKDPIFFLTASGAFQYTTSTSVLQRFDIPNFQNARNVAVEGDTLLLTGEKNIITYSISTRAANNFIYPQQMTGIAPVKLLDQDGNRLLLYPSAMALYHADINAWELSSLVAAKQKNGGLSWDDNGAKVRYAQGVESQLKGSISQLATLQSQGGDTAFYTPAKPGDALYSDLTLHTTLSKDRYADIFFRKEAGNLPEKGLFYRGAADDRVESARLGTNTYTTQLSQTLPSVQYEGANAIVHSESALKNRDRKIVRAQGGGGLLTEKTVCKVLPYAIEGQYDLRDSVKHLTIVPGSIKLTVDGEDVDSSYYSFTALNGNLTILRRDLLDPTSVIIATYKVQTKPDSGLGTVELMPKNNFGQMEYASATVSPVDWVSVEGGYTGVQSESKSPRRDIANVMLPFEFRKEKPDFLLKLTPEMSYETGQKAKATALGVQSRIGEWLLGKSTSLLLNYEDFDSSYSSTDTLTKGFGKLKKDIDVTIKHDIITELPLQYSQSSQTSELGTERHQQASAGAHFQNLPFLDLTWSKNVVDVDNALERSKDTTADTLLLDRNKTKIKLDLYELSSPYVQTLLHLNKFAYELAYTRFTSNKESQFLPQPGANAISLPGSGDIYYGSATLSPLSSITLTGQTTYKKSRQDSIFVTVDSLNHDTLHTTKKMTNVELNPNLLLQTIDAPPGIDLSALYSIDYSGAMNDSLGAAEHLDRGALSMQRQFLLIAKPGVWTKYLSWMSPRFGLAQTITAPFDSTQQVPQASTLLWDPHKQGSVVQTYGVYLYLTSDITFRQEDYFTTSDSTLNLHVFNDLKWWFGANHLWQTRWEVFQKKDNPAAHLSPMKQVDQRMFTFFDATWASWLHSNEQITAEYSTVDSVPIARWDTANGGGFPKDTALAHTTKLDIGPELTATFSLQNSGPIRLLLNGHTLKVTWQDENGRFKPGVLVSYSTSLQINIKPNISFETYHTVSFKQGTLDSYYGNLLCKLLF